LDASGNLSGTTEGGGMAFELIPPKTAGTARTLDVLYGFSFCGYRCVPP
jgi:hypothetical protein